MDKDKIQRIVQSLSEESLDKMIAISMFSSKLRQLNLSDTIETQLHFLSNYREVNSGNLTKKDFCPYQEKFLEKIAAENLMSCHLENQIVDLSPLLAIIAIQRFAINTNDNKYNIKKKSVIQEYYNLLEKSSSLFSCISFPCCAGMAYLSSEIIYLYAGEKYIAVAFPFFLFCFRYLISNFDSILAKQILLATGNEKCLTRIYYIGGIYNVLVKIILISLGKLTAASCIISTTSADILVIVLQMIQIKKFSIQNKTFNKNLIIPFITSMCFVFVIWPIRNLFPELSLGYAVLRCVLSIVICSIFYFFVLFLTKNKVLFDFIKGVKK